MRLEIAANVGLWACLLGLWWPLPVAAQGGPAPVEQPAPVERQAPSEPPAPVESPRPVPGEQQHPGEQPTPAQQPASPDATLPSDLPGPAPSGVAPPVAGTAAALSDGLPPPPTQEPGTASSAQPPAPSPELVHAAQAKAARAAKTPATPALELPAVPQVSYEWQRTSRLLEAEHLEVDPAPQGKRIAFIRIVRDDVFVKDEIWPLWFNWFHGRTRESVVKRELLFEKGALYEEARIEETMRNLRGMGIFALVRIVPVKTDKADEVGVLVHTRDLWSLRLEQDFSTTGSTLNSLLLRANELNAFGHNKTVSADLTLLPKSYTIAQSYYTRRVLGSAYSITERAGLVFNRETRDVEGNLWSLRLEKPFYALKQRVAWLASYERDDRVVRAIQDGQVLLFPEQEGYPGPYTQRKYRRKYDRGSLLGAYRMGERVKQAFSGGWDYRNQDASSIEVPAELEEAFAIHVLPKERRESGPTFSYDLFTPTWVTFVNLSTYGQSENVRVGPRVILSTRLPIRAFGSTTDSWVLSGDLGWTLAPRGALIDMRAAMSGRYEGGQFVDRRTILLLRGGSPTFWILRLVGSISFDLRKRDTQNTYVTLGGDAGLRGYASQALRDFGANRAVANFELRTLPLQWQAVQLGGVIFYDVGSVYQNLEYFQADHAVGVGLRLLFPQFNRYPFTFDFGQAIQPGFRILPTLMGGQFVPITAAEDPP